MSEVSKANPLCTWGDKCRDQRKCSMKQPHEHIPNLCYHFLANICHWQPCTKVHATHVENNLWKVNEVTFAVDLDKLPKEKSSKCPREEKAPAASCKSSAQASVGSVNENVLKSLTLDKSHMNAAFLALAEDNLQPMHDLQATLIAAVEALTVHLNKVNVQLRK